MKKNVSLKLCFLLSILLIQTSNQNFLQFDTKTKCPKIPLTSLGILISLAESDDSTYESTLSVDERAPYESIVELKRSFASTMSYIPQSFKPETEEYWSGINTLLIIFIILAAFPTVFIIFYLIVRFICRKCTGPKKLSEVNKIYRNLTWLVMLVSTIISAILFAVVLIKSIAVGKNISIAFDYAVEKIAESDKAYPEIEKVVNDFRSQHLAVPTKKYMEHFKENLLQYLDRVTKCNEYYGQMYKVEEIIELMEYFESAENQSEEARKISKQIVTNITNRQGNKEKYT